MPRVVGFSHARNNASPMTSPAPHLQPQESYRIVTRLQTAGNAWEFGPARPHGSVDGRDASNRIRDRERLTVLRHDSPVTDVWMSINPAHEVTESLTSTEGTESIRGSFADFLEHSEMAMDQVQGQGQLDEHMAQMNIDKMDHTLPADDGMRPLRAKLQEIRDLVVSTEEKAKRMHAIMTETYMVHKGLPSPLSLDDGDVKRWEDEPMPLDVGIAALPIDVSNPYNLRPGDLEPTFSPLKVIQRDDRESADQPESSEQPALGCMHYLRNVKIQCFDCNRWFPCRHCHDQASDLPFPHALRRKMTRNMLCQLCRTPQPAAEVCANCLEWTAYYYCAICKLWDNDNNKRIYHCDDCGICRLGEGLGKDFVHCKKCRVCISISTSAAHPCVEGATEGDCPLCLDEMFASREKVVSLPCGHYMHAVCYKDLMAVTYKCPVCSKSAVNMELQWRKLDDEIRMQPMPEEDEDMHGVLPHVEGHVGEPQNTDIRQITTARPKTVWIGCNDCGGRCWTAFHWLGLKCRVCDSYNTNQIAPTAGYETETERLLRQQQVHRQHDFTGNAVLRDAGIGADDAAPIIEPELDTPASPSLLAIPASPGSAHSGASSPRRYFVQPEEVRRHSFTVPRFSTPTLPTLADLPEMPRLPRMPNIPQLPHMPTMANMPHLPQMSELGFPSFSAYEMFDSLSRSLSPMRYYLQGHDIGDEQLRRVANRSPTSVHSDPTANVASSRRKRRIQIARADRADSWASDGQSLSGGDDSDDGIGDRESGAEEEDEEESDTESEEFSDIDMIEDDDLDVMLPGHR